MMTEEQVREIAERWRQQHKRLADTEVELTRWRGYWWATFPRPDEPEGRLGATVLLIHPEDGTIQPGSSSILPSTMIERLERARRSPAEQ